MKNSNVWAGADAYWSAFPKSLSNQQEKTEMTIELATPSAEESEYILAEISPRKDAERLREIARTCFSYNKPGDDVIKHDLHEIAQRVMNLLPDDEPMRKMGYENLKITLDRAYSQAAYGKGHERHANGEPFDAQVIMDMARRFGVGSLLGQAFKKSEESQRLPTDRAVNELLGAIVYLAAAVIHIEREASLRDLAEQQIHNNGKDHK